MDVRDLSRFESGTLDCGLTKICTSPYTSMMPVRFFAFFPLCHDVLSLLPRDLK